MFSTTKAFLVALAASAVSATNFSAWPDKYCGEVEYNIFNPPTYILPSLEPYLNGSCFQLPTGIGSLKTHFSDFTEAYLVGYFYLDAACSNLGLAVENGGSGSPEYPVADGQCVQAPPFRSPLTNGSWQSFTLSTFR
ncbi:hypothetical protein EV356DRAFT_564444 [Viridothelium virens]|uniref:Uncharacterized protein n=1 Tax=Viridothelium virens TaxID=1048519 RepID=A0A6A6HIY1_VIRVR|nr:hypothetical protein EV356DRAFT_564444 [Viridothelium virens]